MDSPVDVVREWFNRSPDAGEHDDERAALERAENDAEAVVYALEAAGWRIVPAPDGQLVDAMKAALAASFPPAAGSGPASACAEVAAAFYAGWIPPERLERVGWRCPAHHICPGPSCDDAEPVYRITPDGQNGENDG